jgi:hypothetical protein
MSYVICVCLRIVVCPPYIVLLVLICLSSSMLPVSLDCPFLIVPSIFSNVYVQFLWIVHFFLPLRYSLTFIYSFSGLSIFDCPFGIL